MTRSRQLPTDPFTLLSLFATHAPPAGYESDDPRHPSRVPTRVFVLGVNERRVTLYSQQCRALNLIWLLHETGVLKSSSPGRVAVVGAGAGGLTAAAGAACKGHEVFLLNKSLDAMPQQRFARHRWLHPRIFDWPLRRRRERADPGLPDVPGPVSCREV
jgi:NADPH-dependent 2,4-dienoyl-CoA reductase/sulfur reductase-like enzyme